MIEKAAEALEVKADLLQEFDVEDPFHGHALRGFLCRKPDHRYGALYLTHVNDDEEPQIIYATPKLHYPFDRTGTYRFPAARAVEVYDKLDGSNVLAFYYRWRGQKFLTYKLRLALLRNSRFGAFLDMWREMLQAYPEIPRLPEINNCSISFELYGASNRHLVLYEVPLATAVLFGVDEQGRIRPPSALQLRGVPAAALVARLEQAGDYQAIYQAQQAECETGNETLEDGAIRGTEGRVWYLFTADGNAHMFKCKPESVEQIHFAATVRLSHSIVRATAHNVLETDPTVTYEGVKALLLEDYSEEEIEKYRPHIDAIVAEVNEQMRFREQVLTAYDALGLDINTQKGDVMRALAQQFPKNLMRKVFTALERERMP